MKKYIVGNINIVDEDPVVLLEIANNPKTRPGSLRIIYDSILQEDDDTFMDDDTYGIQLAVASNPHTPSDILHRLAVDSGNYTVRVRVARNPNATYDTLVLLSTDTFASVRLSLARRANIPYEIAKTLAKDSFSGVRAGLANNLDVPLDILLQLAFDKDTDVRGFASRIINIPDLPSEMIYKLAKLPDAFVRGNLVRHQSNMPPDILTKLAQDKESFVMLAVAGHPNTPNDTLVDILTTHPKNWAVQQEIVSNPSASNDLLQYLRDFGGTYDIKLLAYTALKDRGCI